MVSVLGTQVLEFERSRRAHSLHCPVGQWQPVSTKLIFYDSVSVLTSLRLSGVVSLSSNDFNESENILTNQIIECLKP